MVSLPPIAFAVIVVYVISITCVFAFLLISDISAKRQRKARAASRADPVEQAYADTGFALDVEPAPTDDELPPVDEVDVQKLVFDIYQEQTRARFKGIYGEDGQT